MTSASCSSLFEEIRPAFSARGRRCRRTGQPRLSNRNVRGSTGRAWTGDVAEVRGSWETAKFHTVYLNPLRPPLPLRCPCVELGVARGLGPCPPRLPVLPVPPPLPCRGPGSGGPPGPRNGECGKPLTGMSERRVSQTGGHVLLATHIARSGRPSLEQRPARCCQEGAPARDRASAAGYPRPPRCGTPQPPG